ncbi:MAG: DUF1559 domain-containing protein [Pseudomonadota bacterium]
MTIRPRALSKVSRARRALTLIELLVVIAIIGVLIGMLLPAIQAARESSSRASCANNLKQHGIALDLHHDSRRRYPIDGENGFGMSTFLLPFVEESTLYDELQPLRNESPDPSRARPGLEDKEVTLFRCPSFGGQVLLETSRFARTNYRGTQSLFSEKKVYEDIRDGESKTIAMGETVQDQAWALPGATPPSPPISDGAFSSRHMGGAQFVFCDTSVHFISETVDPEVFQALCTIDGRETVSDW